MGYETDGHISIETRSVVHFDSGGREDSKVGVCQAGIFHDVMLGSLLQGLVFMNRDNDRHMPWLFVTMVTAPNPLEHPSPSLQNSPHLIA